MFSTSQFPSMMVVNIPVQGQLDNWDTSSFDRDGNEYTGNNGWSVTDNFSCFPGDCGSYATGSYYGNPYPPPAPGAAVRGLSTILLRM
mmetsp:Transcript_16432/g.32887  ORF Transcript_16432/g.32887 Transcript_16432/m.32887 type:complete len:88 (-) Transcript_16432:137-400(-)|eukprot:CAMPEP_0181292408 /NCGR_PEP_ID=MMETSP1101-20121128/2489_1 /TAXON_ID=46948 /ORGANISM="Rhodomonas abbreviata, Strain Caron Lab Isolate" /LENGTH=87 /DNA_ID=CAMNT_0023396873 /DNA_START=14 /DNA_END=277 /DNA_ORIENTATION=-